MALPAILAGLSPIFGALGAVAKGWMETRKVKAEGKVKIAKAKVDAKIRSIEATQQMDVEAASDMKYSWKDEYLTILMSIPVIMCFVPGLEAYALRGFEILGQTPEWYRWAFLGIIAATFGLRIWLRKLFGG